MCKHFVVCYRYVWVCVVLWQWKCMTMKVYVIEINNPFIYVICASVCKCEIYQFTLFFFFLFFFPFFFFWCVYCSMCWNELCNITIWTSARCDIVGSNCQEANGIFCELLVQYPYLLCPTPLRKLWVWYCLLFQVLSLGINKDLWLGWAWLDSSTLMTDDRLYSTILGSLETHCACM